MRVGLVAQKDAMERQTPHAEAQRVELGPHGPWPSVKCLRTRIPRILRMLRIVMPRKDPPFQRNFRLGLPRWA